MALHDGFVCGEAINRLSTRPKVHVGPDTVGSSTPSGSSSCPPSAGILHDSPPQSRPLASLRSRRLADPGVRKLAKILWMRQLTPDPPPPSLTPRSLAPTSCCCSQRSSPRGDPWRRWSRQ